MGMRLGMPELLIILLVVLLLFGAKRLPEIGSSLGKSLRAFKKSVGDIDGTTPAKRATARKRATTRKGLAAVATPVATTSKDEEPKA